MIDAQHIMHLVTSSQVPPDSAVDCKRRPKSASFLVIGTPIFGHVYLIGTTLSKRESMPRMTAFHIFSSTRCSRETVISFLRARLLDRELNDIWSGAMLLSTTASIGSMAKFYDNFSGSTRNATFTNKGKNMAQKVNKKRRKEPFSGEVAILFRFMTLSLTLPMSTKVASHPKTCLWRLWEDCTNWKSTWFTIFALKVEFLISLDTTIWRHVKENISIKLYSFQWLTLQCIKM